MNSPDLSSECLRKIDEMQQLRAKHPEIEAIAKKVESMSIKDSLEEAARISQNKDVEPWLKNVIIFVVTAMACIDFELGERPFE